MISSGGLSAKENVTCAFPSKKNYQLEEGEAVNDTNHSEHFRRLRRRVREDIVTVTEEKIPQKNVRTRNAVAGSRESARRHGASHCRPRSRSCVQTIHRVHAKCRRVMRQRVRS